MNMEQEVFWKPETFFEKTGVPFFRLNVYYSKSDISIKGCPAKGNVLI